MVPVRQKKQILAIDLKYIKKGEDLSQPCSPSLAPIAVFSDSSNVSKMSLLISFFIGIQMLHLVVTSPSFRFLPPMCNSSEVKVAAEVAINKLNAHRKEGYVLGLQRIFDVHEILQVRSPSSVDFFLSFNLIASIFKDVLLNQVYLDW